MNVTSLLRQSVRYHADRVAVIVDGRSITYGEAWDRGVRVANGLARAGVGQADRVAVLERNSLEAADNYLGCAIGGFCRVPLYARNKRQSHIKMLNNVAATTLVVDEEFVHEVHGLAGEVPSLQRIIFRDSAYERWLVDQDSNDPMVEGRPNDIFVIRHTGGTTGDPLAAPFTHKQWYHTARDYFYLVPPPSPGDVCLHVGPISHASGYWFLPMWMAGGAQVLIDGLSPRALASTIAQERVTHMFMPPTMLNMVCRADGIESYDFSALRCLLVGSAPTSEGTLIQARRLFGDALHQLAGAPRRA